MAVLLAVVTFHHQVCLLGLIRLDRPDGLLLGYQGTANDRCFLVNGFFGCIGIRHNGCDLRDFPVQQFHLLI